MRSTIWPQKLINFPKRLMKKGKSEKLCRTQKDRRDFVSSTFFQTIFSAGMFSAVFLCFLVLVYFCCSFLIRTFSPRCEEMLIIRHEHLSEICVLFPFFPRLRCVFLITNAQETSRYIFFFGGARGFPHLSIMFD